MTKFEDSISMVIPTHNRVGMLKEAIESCVNQTVPFKEILVVDDVGSEEVSSLIKEFSRNTPSLLYIHNDVYPGAPTSRNMGAQNSTSSYIAFLDDDDLIAPTYVEDKLKIIDMLKPDGLVCWAQGIDRKGRNFVPTQYPEDFNFKKDFSGVNPGFRGSNICLKREVFFDLGMFNKVLKKSQDLDLYVRFITSGYELKVVTACLSVARQHGDLRITKPYFGNRGYYDSLRIYYNTHKKYFNLKAKVFTLSTIAMCSEGKGFSKIEKIKNLLVYCFLMVPSFFLLEPRVHKKCYSWSKVLRVVRVRGDRILMFRFKKNIKKIILNKFSG